MSEGNPQFYDETVEQLLGDGILHREDSILVVCGGQLDRRVFAERGFTDVTISNVDTRPNPAGFAPFPWAYQDVEHLGYEDGSFDFVVVHSGLHHCWSPHRGLLEMYRVARRGVLLFEPYDNLVTRLGLRLNIGQEYEHSSVARNAFAFGGVGNSGIPNFVYRFTAAEIVKTVNCFDPRAKADVRFFHRMRIPWQALKARPNKSAYLAAKVAAPALRVVERLFPKECNNFGALVLKPGPDQLHPWLRLDGDRLAIDEAWIADRYGYKR